MIPIVMSNSFDIPLLFDWINNKCRCIYLTKLNPKRKKKFYSLVFENIPSKVRKTNNPIDHSRLNLLDTKLILVPEGTLNRKKYWLNEYPIVLQNVHILNKQITNKHFYEKSKFDTEEFFNNSQATLSLFFETCPDKEDWFHR